MDFNRYPIDDSAVVAEFAYMTVCMEGKHNLACLDGYIHRKGSGINDNMGCYFAEELDPKDPNRRDNHILVYCEDDYGTVKKVYLSEDQFYRELVNAYERAAFLFSENEWELIQSKLKQLKSSFCSA